VYPILRLIAWLIAFIVLPAAAADVSYGPSREQTLEVHVPAGAHDAPILVMVHGGAWIVGDKDNPGVIDGKLAHWGSQGAIVVSVNYRLWPAASPLEQAVDVASALAWVQRHAHEWHGDPSRIVLMGHSAGAHLVSLLAVSPDIARQAGVAPWLATVSLDSGAVDLPQIMNAPHARFYDRVFGRDPAGWPAASPLDRLVRAPATPMLMVCSSARAQSCGANERFAAKVNALGGRAATLPVALDHMGINRELGTDPGYTRQVDAWLRAVGWP
jgi:acetyl esterase/lipase